jgi:hypothetical protein
MGFLTATMTAELLLHDKSERRNNILDWLWTGDNWKRHKFLRDRRVANTGTWFLEAESFKKWSCGENPVLICLGMRTVPSKFVLIIAGSGKSFITFKIL